MNEQSFSTRQSIGVLSMFLIGSSVIFQAGKESGRDIWLCILVALIMALPLALLYARLMQVFPGRNLFDLQLDLFGPVFGRVMALIYTWFALHLGSMVIKNFTDFIQITTLDMTPQFVTSICIGLLCIWCIRAGVNTLGRYAAMALPVYLVIFAVVTLLSMDLLNQFKYVTPIMYNGFAPVFRGAVDILAFPYEEAILLPFILQPLKENKKARKIFITGFAISAAVFLVVFTRNILILSSQFTNMIYYPSYMAISIIDIGDFIQRLDVLIAVIFFMNGFVKISVCLYVASLGLSKLVGIGDYKQFAAPVGMLMISMSLFSYPNILYQSDWSTRIYKYYVLPIGVVLPTIIWLTAEWKRKKLKKKGQLPDPPIIGEETPVTRQDHSAQQTLEGGVGGQQQI